MVAPLKTWKLYPTAQPSSLWSLTSLSGVVYVRAVNPYEARRLVAQQFRRYGPLGASEGREAPSPCFDPDLVCCVEITDPRFDVLQFPTVLTEAEALEIAAPHRAVIVHTM